MRVPHPSQGDSLGSPVMRHPSKRHSESTHIEQSYGQIILVAFGNQHSAYCPCSCRSLIRWKAALATSS